MGIVVEATDTERDRRVALKLIRPGLLPFEQSRQRFEQEIDALTRLEHPGIARVLDSGQDRGFRYYAMELVDGESFAQVLERLRGRRPGELRGRDLFASHLEPVDPATSERTVLLAANWITACVHVVRDTALAVEHAHESGVLHRDIKPGNVMLGYDGRVRLLDFGLARAEGDATLTRSGTAVGSLPHMAPEQLRGERDAIGARADVYALGVLLYELLALRAPFLDAGNAQRTRQNILRGRAAPLRRGNSGVSRQLAEVCARAMAAAASERFATAAELAGELDALLAAETAVATAGHRSFVQRHAGFVAIVAAVALLATVVSTIGWLAEVRARQVLLAAQVEQERALAESHATATQQGWNAYRGLVAAAQGALLDHDFARARELLAAAPPEHRGFEWRHLRSRCAPVDPSFRLEGGAWEFGVAADGTWIFGIANRVLAWCDPSDGRVVRRVELPISHGHAFTADGSVCAYTLKDQRSRLHLLDVDSGSRRELELDDAVRSVELSADGALLALGLARGECALIETSSLRERHRLRLGHPFPAGLGWEALRLDGAGRRVAVAGSGGLVSCWDTSTGERIWSAQTVGGGVPQLRFGAAGKQLFVMTRRSWVYILDASTGDEVGVIESPRAARIAVDPDGEHLWVADDAVVRCIHTATREIVGELRAGADPIIQLAVVGDRIVFGDRAGRIWQQSVTDVRRDCVIGPERRFTKGLLHPDGAVLLYSSKWPAELHVPGAPPIELELPPLRLAAFVGERFLVAATAAAGQLLVWNLESGTISARLAPGEQVAAVAAIGPGAVLTGNRDGHVRVWHIGSGAGETIGKAPAAIERVAVSPVGEWVAAGTRRGHVIVWGRDVAEPVFMDASAKGTVFALTFGPQGRLLAAGGNAGLRVFDLNAGRLIHRRAVHTTEHVAGLAFTADGRRLVHTSHHTPAVRLWDVRTWDLVVALRGHSHKLDNACLSPDGTTLLTADYNGIARVWRAPR